MDNRKKSSKKREPMDMHSGAFENVPNEIIFKIANYLKSDQSDQSRFAITCGLFYRNSQPDRILDKQASLLLQAVINRKNNEIAERLKNHPESLLRKGTAKDDAGLLFHCTPLEYAIHVKDWYTAIGLLIHLNKLEQSPKLKKYAFEIYTLLNQELPLYFDYIAHCHKWAQPERRAAIYRINAGNLDTEAVTLRKAYLNYIDNFISLNLDERALERKKITILEKSRTIHGGDYDLIPFIEAYLKYIENFTPWTKQQCEEFWCQVIGFFQARLPRFFIHQFFYRDRSFDSTLTFLEPIIPALSKLDDGNDVFTEEIRSKLGSEFAMFRSGSLGNVMVAKIGPFQNVIQNLHGFIKLYKIGSEKMRELNQLLPQIQNLSNLSSKRMP